MTEVSDKIKEIVNRRKLSIEEDIKFRDLLDKRVFRENNIPLSEAIKKSHGNSIISEIKLASPTLGAIRPKSDIKNIAIEMEKSGAVGLSILTEPNFFNGSYENLRIASEGTNIPCLMKDFVIHPIQFMIAAQLAATNILLINSICDLGEYYRLATDYGLEPLIEIHEADEIYNIRSLFDEGLNPKLIGVNNRNLRTLEIDLDTSLTLIPEIKDEFGKDIQVVSESGIHTVEDINYLKPSGADAYLIGSSIMQSSNISEKITQLRGIV